MKLENKIVIIIFLLIFNTTLIVLLNDNVKREIGKIPTIYDTVHDTITVYKDTIQIHYYKH